MSSFGTLETEARQEAKKILQGSLTSYESLLRVDHLRQQFRAQKKHVDQKVQALVQAHLAEIAYLTGLLNDNLSRDGEARKFLKTIQELCAETIKVLPDQDFPAITAIRTLRNNLEDTLALLTIFSDIPLMVHRITSELDTPSPNYRSVYLQLRDLYKIKEKSQQHGKSFGDAKELMDARFLSVDLVSEQLKLALFRNVEECIDLAADDPRGLVLTLQVIEMEDRVQKFKLFGRSSLSMKDQALAKLEGSLVEYFAVAFHDAELTSQKVDVAIVTVLQASRKLIRELEFILDYVVPCFPPHWEIAEFFRFRYIKWVNSRVILTMSEPSQMAPGNILQSIGWLKDYEIALRGIDYDDEGLFDQMHSLAVTLFETYLVRERQMLNELFGSILKVDWRSEPMVNNGLFITSAPQDMFKFITTHLDTAKEKIDDADLFIKCVKVVNRSLLDYQEKFIRLLERRVLSFIFDLLEEGSDKPEEFLVAVLNNCTLCQDNLAAVQEDCSNHLRQHGGDFDEIEMVLEEIFDESVTGFVVIGTKSAQLVAESLMRLIEEDLFKLLFTTEWVEDGYGTIAQSIVATFVDFYSNDYEPGIISQFFFAQLIKQSILLFVGRYVDASLNAPSSVRGHEAFGETMERDLRLVQDFFQAEPYVGLVTEQYVVLQFDYSETVRSLLTCDEGWIAGYFASIHKVHGEGGAETLQRILSKRSNIESKTVRSLVEEYCRRYPQKSGSERPTPKSTSIMSSFFGQKKH